MYEWLRDCLAFCNHGVMNDKQDVMNGELKKLDTPDDSHNTARDQ